MRDIDGTGDSSMKKTIRGVGPAARRNDDKNGTRLSRGMFVAIPMQMSTIGRSGGLADSLDADGTSARGPRLPSKLMDSVPLRCSSGRRCNRH